SPRRGGAAAHGASRATGALVTVEGSGRTAARERSLAVALLGPDAAESIIGAERAGTLPAGSQAQADGLNGDGWRLTALLVAKLRFERLLRGSGALDAWFDRDPAGFTEAFRRYHHDVLPTAFFPS